MVEVEMVKILKTFPNGDDLEDQKRRNVFKGDIVITISLKFLTETYKSLSDSPLQFKDINKV